MLRAVLGRLTLMIALLLLARAAHAGAASNLFASTDAGPARDPASPMRAVWVTRWDFRTPADVRRIIADCAALQVSDVIWQARGQADAFYRSDLEPWGRELFLDLPLGVTDPGFDPLALAVNEAHERGLRLHAWVNVMPLWKGKTPPDDPSHLFHARPQWRLHDAKGQPQALNDHYVIVNPVLEEVQDHLVAVCKDIVTRYAIDGLHMDYIRFVSEKMDPAAIMPADAASFEAFRAATGHGAPRTPDELAAYQDWKRQRITDLVRRIRTEAAESREGCALTAAVWRRPDLGLNQYLQDAAAWLRDGLIDRAFPMIYTDKPDQFTSDVTAWVEAARGRYVTPGLGVYLQKPEGTPAQIEAAAALGADGYALFSYESMFETVNPLQAKTPEMIGMRAARLAAYQAWTAQHPVPNRVRPDEGGEPGHEPGHELGDEPRP